MLFLHASFWYAEVKWSEPFWRIVVGALGCDAAVKANGLHCSWVKLRGPHKTFFCWCNTKICTSSVRYSNNGWGILLFVNNKRSNIQGNRRQVITSCSSHDQIVSVTVHLDKYYQSWLLFGADSFLILARCLKLYQSDFGVSLHTQVHPWQPQVWHIIYPNLRPD